MTDFEKGQVILFLRPRAKFVMRGDKVEWYDETQTEPTQAEIDAAWIPYQEKLEADKAAAQAQKQAILDRLGLTEEELRIVLG